MSKRIFVFGSNLAGRHGAGAALYARANFGAVLGKGVGRQGNSYGIPTKGYNMKVLNLEVIGDYVKGFIQYAQEHPELVFKVTTVGTGYAGYSHEEIAPLFQGSPNNCIFDSRWKSFLGPEYVYFEYAFL